MKKLLALILAAVMLFALCACSGGTGGNTAANVDPLTKDDVIKLTVFSHPSWPYNENWKIWDYIEEGTGATLDVTAIPNSDAYTKIPLMFAAPDTLPDLLTFDYKPSTDTYALQGALISYEDMADYMPNYNAWVGSLSEEDYNAQIVTRKAADGKIYYSPIMGREATQNVRAWLYRKDIFEKNNLKVPTTFDELYEVCKELKKLYPDSYPFCMRQSFTNLDVTGSSWKPYWETGIYYDFDNQKFSYGAIEPITVEILEFYIKMVEEGLMPPNFMTIATNEWQELVTTDRGFIMPEYQTRIDFFNSIAQEGGSDFFLTAMEPPVAKADTGASMVGKYNLDPIGTVICNTGDDKRISNSAKFLDWFYSDEAMDLVSWGKEGETYEMANGEKKYIQPNGEQVNSLYGIGTFGAFYRIDPVANDQAQSEEILNTREMIMEHTLPNFNPWLWLSLNDEEMAVQEKTSVAIQTYVQEMLSKFILKQEPLSNFDSFVETVKGMGVDELLAAYESAYARVK